MARVQSLLYIQCLTCNQDRPKCHPQRPFTASSLPTSGEAIGDVVAELAAAAATLGKALHPRTAFSLADTVRIMNAYYSNLIEGHNTRPRDIERALAGELDEDAGRRELQLEAASHVRLQKVHG